MSSDRKTSITTGILFVLATVAALAAAAVVPATTGPGYLTGIARDPHRVAAAALLYLIAAGTSAGIAVALHPLLTRVDPAAALGSVVFRTVEAVFYTVAVVCLLPLVPLAQQFATAPVDGRASTLALADALLAVRDRSTLAGVLAFCTGASLYYAVLHRSRLVPRWLTGWGLAATLLMATACLLALFADRPVTGYPALILPIAIQELVLAGWLLFKGFDVAGVAAGLKSAPASPDAYPRTSGEGAWGK